MSWLQLAREKVERFGLEQVSSRSLGLIRILTCLDIIFEYASPWVSHRVDNELEILVLTWIVFLSNWFVLVGYKTRIASAILFCSFGVLHLWYGQWLGMNMFRQPVQMFQVITVLALAPSGRSLSIDRALEVRRAKREGRAPPPEQLSYWVLDVLAVEVAAIYLWAGLDKTDPAWFRGERMEHYYMFWYGSSDSLIYTPWIHEISVVMAWATTILELSLAFGLVFRRTRYYVVWGGFVLHIGILFYFAVTYFSMMMMTVLIACIPPKWVHDFISLIGQDSNTAPPVDAPPDTRGSGPDLVA
ncbi:MAG TPA: HTTM domain-containing protein [Enhygromyxa sp.]|nr:HTTM domain-containing protein [Enhygromyxa sp.]